MGLFAWASQDLPTPEGIAHRVVQQSTKIYDRTGKVVLYDLHGAERRTAVDLSAIPANLKWATITAEDREFYQHHGFRFTSLVRAVLVDILSGAKLQGGSTITQQFIKNAIVGGEKSFLRKIKELILAYQIEQKFSKDEILKLYFNEIPYGSNAYGAEAAAQTFFGKSVKDINLAESAILAALPQAPTYYSPWGNHRDALIARQHFILDNMVQQGYIKQAEADTAKKTTLTFVPRREGIIAPHFVFYIKELLVNKYGEQAVEQGGYKVITTLDLDKQKMAENAITASAQKNLPYNAQNAGLVAIDVPTGQILAMVGSRDYFDDTHDGQVNVTLRPFQPGSSFKPIVYTTAFTEGFRPETLLYDVETVFKTDTKDYIPHDYDGKERGPISLRQALAGSLNIPAVKLLYLTGIDKVLDFAHKLGYTTLNDRSRFGLSLVLGGAEVTPLDHTNAYATFAREGVYKPTTAILRVEDASGTALEQYQDTPGQPVVDPQPVRVLTDILSDNQARAFIFGAQNHLILPDRLVAAKTGTTNDYHDAWTLGYTPQLAAGVWVGNNDNSAMKKGADGSVVAAPIWQDFMTHALANQPVIPFTAPQPIPTTNKAVLDGELGQTMIIDSVSGKLATDLTPPEYRITKVFHTYHTILQYVTPGDPLGPLPTNPTQDQQYPTWEAAVRNWAASHNLFDEQLPTLTDDVHTLANQPQISIIYPQTNQTTTSNPVPFAVQVSAGHPIASVHYYLDDQDIGTSTSAPWGLSFIITTQWQNGFHTIRAVVKDVLGNTNNTSAVFNLLVNPAPNPVPISFLSPTPNQSLTAKDFPFTITITNDQPEQTKQIDFYTAPTGGSPQWLGVISGSQKQTSLLWPSTAPGVYTISTLITQPNSTSLAGPKITVTITP